MGSKVARCCRQLGRANFWFTGSQPRAVLCAAKHDEGVYRLHAPTSRQHHERIDVQLCQVSVKEVSFKIHGEVRHAHEGIRERLEVRRRESPGATGLL